MKTPKLVVSIEPSQNGFKTVSVYDNREKAYWSKERIYERGIVNFLDLADVKETLNWCLNGDEKKYSFKRGIARIYD